MNHDSRSAAARHPREVLFEDGDPAAALPVCDHYCGIEPRMRKSLALQAEMGPVFDVTLDNEDGAPVGGEVEHAHLIAELLDSSANRWGRVGVRLLDVQHPRFEAVASRILRAARRPAYLMIPKPRSVVDIDRAATLLDGLGGGGIPLHALVETHGAVADVQAMAAHPRIESLSFGLMDFVSAHRGAIPAWAMGASGQFSHPLVVRAKLEIAAACHAQGKVPSHSVVTEFRDTQALRESVRRAREELGFTRMWSIHPDQIATIVQAFTPADDEIAESADILLTAQAADWAPIRHRDVLHDRASYRFHWHRLKTARTTGAKGLDAVPESVRHWLTEGR